ncbi:MAG: hypothetical protein JWO32_686 [Bacteroidetes bacterium]|nr:hypothetical protein [Bacteroidota bacterium]
MKILLLSDTNSEHTEKWALGLAERGITVGLFSFHRANYSWYNHKNIQLLYQPEKDINGGNIFIKIAYLQNVLSLRKAIKEFKPDVLHAHYATSYGLVGALCRFHPFIISCWGTDVMKFPQKNFIAKTILQFNLNSADLICATSNTIKEYIHKVLVKPVTVIPFGVDTHVFKPKEIKSLFSENCFVIGSIKPLEKLYNNDILIRSFAMLEKKYDHIRLLIIGDGSEGGALKKLCNDLNISDKVRFTGRIPFNEISNYFNMLNVLANLSVYESFGVSVIEAMACGKAVVVTNVGGLKEIVVNDEIGLKVNVGNVEQTSEVLESLVLNSQLCKTIGIKAREHVLKNYNWENNLLQMISEYNKLAVDFKSHK